MSDEDARNAEAEYLRSAAAGKFHEVTVDVTIRVTFAMPGNSHLTSDLDEDVISEAALAEGDIIGVEEVY